MFVFFYLILIVSKNLDAVIKKNYTFKFDLLLFKTL